MQNMSPFRSSLWTFFHHSANVHVMLGIIKSFFGQKEEAVAFCFRIALFDLCAV